jgi:hypothetical protein
MLLRAVRSCASMGFDCLFEPLGSCAGAAPHGLEAAVALSASTERERVVATDSSLDRSSRPVTAADPVAIAKPGHGRMRGSSLAMFRLADARAHPIALGPDRRTGRAWGPFRRSHGERAGPAHPRRRVRRSSRTQCTAARASIPLDARSYLATREDVRVYVPPQFTHLGLLWWRSQSVTASNAPPKAPNVQRATREVQRATLGCSGVARRTAAHMRVRGQAALRAIEAHELNADT